MREILRSKIHKATVTKADVSYIGSITIDGNLMEMVGLFAGEKVLVVDLSNGERIETYVIEGVKDSGAIEINGAAAHKIKEGDEVIIIGFEITDKKVDPKIILVDKDNKFLRYL